MMTETGRAAADMTDWARLALYFTPPPGGALDRLGTAWLGRDLASGEETPPPALPGLPRAAAELSAQPRRYGLHATLKNPFRLAPGHGIDALSEALDRFAEAYGAPAPFPLRLSVEERFAALVPAAPVPDLDALAAAIVRAFEPFRAPLTETDRARRRAAGLTERQAALLEEWGYPHVMDEFRFHITLTGRLSPEEAGPVAQALSHWLAPALEAPLAVDALSLCGEDSGGRFHLIRRVPLRG